MPKNKRLVAPIITKHNVHLITHDRIGRPVTATWGYKEENPKDKCCVYGPTSWHHRNGRCSSEKEFDDDLDISPLINHSDFY